MNGTPLASTNLSDTSNLARLNASNVFTGATNTFAAITGTTINATAGFQVGGVALSASDLSNGVSGTGAICLASGSACSPAVTLYYQTMSVGGVSAPQEPVLNFVAGTSVTLTRSDVPGVRTDVTINSSSTVGPNPNVPTITCTGCTPFAGYNDGAGVVSTITSNNGFALAFGGSYSHAMACTASTATDYGVVTEINYPITLESVTSNVASFSGTFTGLTAGTTLDLEGFPTATFFNGQIVTVLATGLSSTQFKANFTHADTGTINDTAFALPNTPYSVFVGINGSGGSGPYTIHYLCHQ